MFVQMIDNNYIIGVGIAPSGNEITQERYNEITDKIHARPVAPDGYTYMLNATTLDWDLVEMPEPSDEIDDGEAMTILMGGE